MPALRSLTPCLPQHSSIVVHPGFKMLANDPVEYEPGECLSQQPSSSLLLSSLELSETKVYEPSIRARFGTAGTLAGKPNSRSRLLWEACPQMLFGPPVCATPCTPERAPGRCRANLQTNQPIKARLWPWLEPVFGKIIESFQVVPRCWTAAARRPTNTMCWLPCREVLLLLLLLYNPRA